MGKRGALKFKNDARKKRKSSKTKHAVEVQQAAPLEPDTKIVKIAPQPTTPQAPTIQNGTGTITTSGTVVTGHGTQFQRQLAAGDAILVKVAEDGETEMRVINMCLSPMSINISSAFSQDATTPTKFQFIRKPRATMTEKRKEQEQKLLDAKEIEEHAFGIYKTGVKDDNSDNNSNEPVTLVYRERTTQGSYRVKTETIDEKVSRSKLLELRSKKTSDKYC